MIPLLLVLLSGPRSPPPRDTLLVEVVLTSTQQKVVVQALLSTDSTLTLPAQTLYTLTGLGTAPLPWVTLDAFRQTVGPSITVLWNPRGLEVAILDPLNVLPASTRAVTRYRTQARDAALSSISGPWATLAVDDSLRAAFDLGYIFAGRFVIEAQADARGHTTWAASAAPDPHFYLTYNSTGQVYGRVSLGPLWVATTWQPGQAPTPSGLVRTGPALLYASTTGALFTWQSTGSQAALQVAHAWKGSTTIALTFGVRPASPFSLPNTTVH